MGGGGEDLPEAVDPVEGLGLHEDGAKASHGFAGAADSRLQRTEEANGQLRNGEVEAALGGSRKDRPRLSGHFADTFGAASKDDNVQSGRKCRDEAVIS